MSQPRDPAVAEIGGGVGAGKCMSGMEKTRSHLAKHPACAGSYLEPGEAEQGAPVERRGSLSETKATCQQQEATEPLWPQF